MADKNAKKMIQKNPKRIKPKLNDPNLTKTFIVQF